MATILTATLLVGLGVTRLLFFFHVNIFAIRYGLAVFLAYAAFVGFIKIWLTYVELCGRRKTSGGDAWFDCVNFSGGGTSSSASDLSFSGAGGKFGGGGASGSWDSGSDSATPRLATAVVAPQPQQSTSSSSTSSSSKSSSKSGGGGGVDDLGELVLVLLIIALVLAVVASFIWIVYAAPVILSEVVFNAALAGALARHTHRATCGEWIGGVVKKTAVPFLLILGLSIAMGWWAQHICPNALRLRDAFHCVRAS